MFRKIIVKEGNRVIVTRNNRFDRLLTPGVHWVFAPAVLRIGTESHDLRSPMLKSKWGQFLIAQRPDIVSRHFVLVATASLEIALISFNNTFYDVLLPSKKVLFWKDAGTIKAEIINIGAEDDPPAIMRVEADSNEVRSEWIYELQEEP